MMQHPFKYFRVLFIIFLFLIIQFIPADKLKAQDVSSPNNDNTLWKAGMSRTVITPPEYMWMAGFASRDKPAEGILHDLWAKAIALEDAGGNRALLITTDIIGFSRDLSVSICNRLINTYGLERKNIILSSSHTHSGPVVNYNLFGIYPPFGEDQIRKVKEFRQFIEEQIIIVAGRAIGSMSPVRLSVGAGMARFAVNRRESGWEGDVMYAPEVKGPSDHVVQVLKVSDPDGIPVAVIFGYSCHATCLTLNKWSGDYPGFTQIELERTYPGITAMFFAGFGADQNAFPRGGILETEQYGKELALAVEKVMKEPTVPLASTIHTLYDEIELDIAPSPDQEELNSIQDKGADWEKRWAKGMQEKIAAGKDLPDSYPHYPVQTWQLGDQTWVILGGEVVVDYAFKFREQFGKELMIMGYANDVMAYIPSERVLKEGGYEGMSSMRAYGHRSNWSPGIEERIGNEVARQVNLIKTMGMVK